MFKYLPCLGGSTSRCRTATLLLMAIVAITFGNVAQAQHGVSINKGCESPVRICDTDAECDDENQCTDDVCDDSLPNMLNCTFTATHDDTFLDTLSINGAWDTVFNNGGPTRVPAVGDADIIASGGNTTCVVGPFAPCTIGPDVGAGTGFVTFISTGYSPTADDPNPLQDQITVLVEDLCNGIPTPDCFPGIDNPVSFGAATILADTCLNEPFPPSTACDLEDGNECTTSGCDGAGNCNPEHEVVTCPPDGSLCTIDFVCDPGTGLCPPPEPIVCPPDDLNCTIDFECDEDTGECPPPEPIVCPEDDLNCTNDFPCDEETGECPPPEPIICPPDDDECTDDFPCDEATGTCPPPGPPLICPPRDDGVICDVCDPETGECIPEEPVPPRCIPGEERCRTPGFWGARGGIEKAPRSQNITQAVIDQAILENGFGLPVCGIYIDNTNLLSNMSAIEAMCVSVKGVTQRQLVRQLTAAALNCVLGDCSPEHTAMLASCNTVCDTGVGDMQGCIDELDCFNNGGDWDGGMCITGAGFCEIGGEACDDDNTCVGLGDSCLPLETCHDRDLCPDLDDDMEINGSDFCFEPPGPASSPRKCSAARKNDTYVP